MAWARVDQDVYRHRKVHRLFDEFPTFALRCIGAWTIMLARSVEAGPRFTLQTLQRVTCLSRPRDARRLAAPLVAVNLWEETSEDLFTIHDWALYQPPKNPGITPGKPQDSPGMTIEGSKDGPSEPESDPLLGLVLGLDLVEDFVFNSKEGDEGERDTRLGHVYSVFVEAWSSHFDRDLPLQPSQEVKRARAVLRELDAAIAAKPLPDGMEWSAALAAWVNAWCSDLDDPSKLRSPYAVFSANPNPGAR